MYRLYLYGIVLVLMMTSQHLFYQLYQPRERKEEGGERGKERGRGGKERGKEEREK